IIKTQGDHNRSCQTFAFFLLKYLFILQNYITVVDLYQDLA
ncbi:MAG: hypothetical protein K0Q49_2594, partial [Haloplasmataceae bacterium]|nr:hypothetical protein [Haloplasmataceae bacterium]